MFAWFSLGFNAFQLAAAGGVMVSLPIVIHLINRMRFRRIRWAAMEFLLKAQKRQRRRLIIEQLILLAMRCLLIAMIGYWLGSFVGFGGDVLNPVGEKQVLHVVILDDSPSMGDAWKDRGIDKTNAFDEAKKVLRERIGPRIVESATRNGSAEYVVVYRLSEIQPVVEDQVLDEDDEAVFADRLNQSSLEELTKLLGDPPMAKPSAVRVRGNPELMAWTLLGRKYANRQLVPEDEWKQVVSDMDAHVLPQRVALDKAQRVFEGKAPEVFEREGHKALFKKDLHAATKQFYFLSDFRQVDWKGPNSEQLREKMDEMVNKKSIKVYGVDCSDPNRGDTRGTLQHHENIGITSFQAEVAVAPEFEPVKFSLVVNNFTNRRFENVHLIVKENGIERPEAHPEGTPFLTLPSGPTVVSWKMSLDKPGINHIEATIEDPEGLRDTGLAADNTRYTVVKVEKLVHILAVEEEFKNPPRGKDGRGDSSKAPDTTGTFYLQKVLRKGYQLDSGRIDDLEKPTLFQYPCVFIMNVPDLSKAAIENLEKFAAEGGGVCFFLGDKVKPEEYNRTLFKDGTGLFPATLDPRIKNLEPTTDEEKARDIQERAARFLAQEPNLFVRDENHPMFAPVYKEEDPDKFVNKFLMFFELKQYFSVDSLRYKKVGDADKVEELFTLPNRKGVQQYMPRANQLAGQLPTSDDPAWKEFQPTLETHRKRLLENTFGRNYKELFELANDVYRLLHEPGNPDGLIKDQPKRPGLDKFWQDPRNDSLRKQFEQFMEDVRYGDPCVVARPFG